VDLFDFSGSLGQIPVGCTLIVQAGWPRIEQIAAIVGADISAINALNGNVAPATYWFVGNRVQLPVAVCDYIVKVIVPGGGCPPGSTYDPRQGLCVPSAPRPRPPTGGQMQVSPVPPGWVEVGFSPDCDVTNYMASRTTASSDMIAQARRYIRSLGSGVGPAPCLFFHAAGVTDAAEYSDAALRQLFKILRLPGAPFEIPM